MKKNYLMIAAMAALALLSSCQKEEVVFTPEPVTVTLKVNCDDITDTKVTYTTDETDNAKLNFSWKALDEISIIPVYKNAELTDGVVRQNCKFTITEISADGKSATFTGTIYSWNGTRNVYIIYPYNENITEYTDAGMPKIPLNTTELRPENYVNYCNNVVLKGVIGNSTFDNFISSSFSLDETISAIRLSINKIPSGQTVKEVNFYREGGNSSFSFGKYFSKVGVTLSGESPSNTISYKVADYSSRLGNIINITLNIPISFTQGTLYCEVITNDEGGTYNYYSYAVSASLSSDPKKNTFYPLTVDCSTAAPFYNGFYDNQYHHRRNCMGKKISMGDLGSAYWAEYNVGYSTADYAYTGIYTSFTYPSGLLFQWGRLSGGSPLTTEYGAGASTRDFYGQATNTAALPSSPNMHAFYTKWTGDNSAWTPLSSSNKKRQTDPCPKGWRVPTNAELTALVAKKGNYIESETINGLTVSGYYVRGSALTDNFGHTNSIFLNADKFRLANGSIGTTPTTSYYWSSDVASAGNSSYSLKVSNTEITARMATSVPIGGLVRCIALR